MGNLFCLTLLEQGFGLGDLKRSQPQLPSVTLSFSHLRVLFVLQVFYFHLGLLLGSLRCQMKVAYKSKRLFLHFLVSRWLSTRASGKESTQAMYK